MSEHEKQNTAPQVYRCMCAEFQEREDDLWHLCQACGGMEPEGFDRLVARGLLKPVEQP